MKNQEAVNNKTRRSLFGALKKGNHRLGPIAFVLSVVLMVGYYTYNNGQIRPVDQPTLSSFTKTFLADGWLRYEKKEEPKFAISLPEKWKTVEINPDDFEAIAQEWEKRNEPDLASYFRDAKVKELAQCCVKMDATGKEALGDISLEIAVESISDIQDLNSFLESKIAEGAENKKTPKSSIKRNHKNLNNTETEILTFSQEQFHNDKKYYLIVSQYYFQKDEKIWSIRLGSTSEVSSFAQMQQPTFERIVNSFEWL